MKRIVISILFFCFWNSVLSQYARYSFLDKPEPEIKIPRDEQIEKGISLQNKQVTTGEKELLYWMNFARLYPKRFFDEVVVPIAKNYPEIAEQKNYLKSLKTDLYNSPQLPITILDYTLFSMAREHANDIKKHNNPSLAHNSSEGLGFQQRVKQFGIKVCASENLSYGKPSILMQLVLLYLDVDEPNLGHRKTLLNPAYTNVGVALVTLSSGETFLVQDFSCASGTK